MNESSKPSEGQFFDAAATIEWANIAEMGSQRWKASDKIFLQIFLQFFLHNQLQNELTKQEGWGPEDHNFY